MMFIIKEEEEEEEEKKGGVSLVTLLLPEEHPPFLPEASDREKDWCNGSVDVCPLTLGAGYSFFITSRSVSLALCRSN